MLIYSVQLQTSVQKINMDTAEKNTSPFFLAPPPPFLNLTKAGHVVNIWNVCGNYSNEPQRQLPCARLLKWQGVTAHHDCVHAMLLRTTSTFQSSSCCWVCHWWPTGLVECNSTYFISSIFCMSMVTSIPGSQCLTVPHPWEGGNGYCCWFQFGRIMLSHPSKMPFARQREDNHIRSYNSRAPRRAWRKTPSSW